MTKSTGTKSENQERLSFVEEIARRGGALIVEGLASATTERTVKSSATDISTQTDLAVQALLVAAITERYPNDSIVAEEDLQVTKDDSRKWIVDPLDGTSNFVRGLWPSVVSIALEVDGELEYGVVFDPVRNEMFSAIRGAGAFLNGVQLERRTESISMDRAFVSVGMTGRESEFPPPPEIIQKLLVPSDSVRDLGASALQICYVAAKRFDAHVVRAVSAWDVAAGFLIAAEAGCLVEGFAPRSMPTHQAALIAVPSLMEELRAVLA